MPIGDYTDFSKLVNWCPAKKFSLFLSPVETFLKKTETFRYVTLVGTSRKKAFTPANSVKLCDTPCSCWWKFHSRNQQDHQWKFHKFFMNTTWVVLTLGICTYSFFNISKSLSVYVLNHFLLPVCVWIFLLRPIAL